MNGTSSAQGSGEHEAAAALPKEARRLIEHLQAQGINTRTVTHKAVFTVEESQALRGTIDGGHCKSLLLRARTGQHYLVLLPEEKRLDINALAKTLAAKRFSFASAEVLHAKLGVSPGSVTPFGIINNSERDVIVVVDNELLRHQHLNFHPLTNTASTAIAPEDLTAVIRKWGNQLHCLDIPARS